jgi:hypothetical protein
VLPAQLKDAYMITDTRNIRDLRQWVCWRTQERDGKPTKVPYSPLTGEKARSTDPATWARYDEAVGAHREHGYHGIGFVFTPEDDLCGVDLDGCLDPETGEIESWAQEIIGELDSYTEISPSRTGVHVLVRAELPKGRNRKGQFEAYDRGRYFTFTGRHLAGTPRSIEARQEQLERVLQRVFGEPESTNGHKTPALAFASQLSDEEIIEKASSAANGEKFRRLLAGDASDYSSPSEADQAFCSSLAFWTGPDPGQIDRLFRQSGLYREKWERRDYRERTIARALDGNRVLLPRAEGQTQEPQRVGQHRQHHFCEVARCASVSGRCHASSVQAIRTRGGRVHRLPARPRGYPGAKSPLRRRGQQSQSRDKEGLARERDSVHRRGEGTWGEEDTCRQSRALSRVEEAS